MNKTTQTQRSKDLSRPSCHPVQKRFPLFRIPVPRAATAAGAALFVLLFAGSAFAIDLEFYTYNGFEPVTIAFRRIALISGADDFTKLVGVVAAAAVLFAGVSFYARYLTGYPGGPANWAWPILTGAVIYLGLFVPTGSLTVYDPVKNRFETIDGIPDAVVLTLGALNKVERVLVDVVDAVAPAGVGYKDGAGGMGIYAVQETLLRGVKDTYLTQSLDEYTRKCVAFELERPGTALTVEDLVNASADFTVQLGLAANPAVWCLRFDPANPAGAAVTCRDAWSDPAQGLRAWFASPANYAAEIDRAAATAGFDPASAAERLRYRALVTNTVREHLALAGITPERLSQQGTIARQLFEFVKDGNPTVAAALRSDQTATAGLFGRGVAANQWIPAIRAVFTALAAGTLPFLALFLPSPFFKRALQFFLGLFVFLTAWGVIDAVAHSFALEYARDYFETVRQSRLSLATWINFPDAATRSFALLGSIRTIGALLAAAVGTVVGVQAPALTALASHLTGPVTEHGAAAGRAVATPRGRAETLDTLASAEAANRTWDNGGRYNVPDVVRGRMHARHGDLGANLGYGSPLDAYATNLGGTRLRAGDVEGRVSASSALGYGARDGAARTAAASAFRGIAGDEAMAGESHLHGGRAALERGAAGIQAARVGGELGGTAAAGGTSVLRAATGKQTAWSIASQNTLGPTAEEAATRAHRRGTVDYEGDAAAFAWADRQGIGDRERGRRSGRLRAQEAFYGALTLQRVAGALGMTDDELLERSGEHAAGRRAGDARAVRKWGPERVAAAQAFGHQHEIVREEEKRAVADALGVPLETLQAMGYRTGHGVLTPNMAEVINRQLAEQGRDEQVAAGQVANWVMDADYNVAFVDTTQGVQTSDLDTATQRQGRTVRAGDSSELGDFERHQDVREWTDDTGHHVRHESWLTGELGAETVRRGIVQDLATGHGATHLVLTPNGIPVWSSAQAGKDRQYYANHLLWLEGPEVNGNIVAGKVAEHVGEEKVVDALRIKKGAEEVMGVIELPVRAVRAGKTLRR